MMFRPHDVPVEEHIKGDLRRARRGMVCGFFAEGVDQVDGIALLEIVDDPDLAGLVAEPDP